MKKSSKSIYYKKIEIETFNKIESGKRASWGERIGWDEEALNCLGKIGPEGTIEKYFSEYLPGTQCLSIAVERALRVKDFAKYVVGIDIAKSPCFKAKEKAKSCEFVVCDAELPAFRDNMFTSIVVVAVLHHLPNIEVALAQMSRMLRKRVIVILYESALLNPITFISRKLFFREALTLGERPFIPLILKRQVPNHRNESLLSHISCLACSLKIYPKWSKKTKDY